MPWQFDAPDVRRSRVPAWLQIIDSCEDLTMHKDREAMKAVCGPELSAVDVYGIWMIRDAVFAVEQHCDLPDVDGVDLRPDCTHIWFSDDLGPTSYLRTYLDHGVRKIGRVATRKDCRGQGLSSQLLREVIRRWGRHELRLGAQAHLHDWYAGFGFERCGDNFMEAGIEHTPMRRPGSEPVRQPPPRFVV